MKKRRIASCRNYRKLHTKQRGAVIVSTLFMILITSILLMGVGMYASAHMSRAFRDAQHANAIYAAEAGLNYELYSLTNGASAHTSASPGEGTIGDARWQATYRVVCKQTNGAEITNPSNLPSTILIEATGTVGEVTRTVSIRARKGSSTFDYAIFSKKSGTINGNQTIQGSVGTGGTVTVNGSNGISDKVLGLHGSTATATINPPGSYQTERRDLIEWPTVPQVALEMFPYGGLEYVKVTNDNNLATAYVNNGQFNGSNYNNKNVSPAIVNSSISANGKGTFTFVGKPGGANYYLNSMTFNGTWVIAFDNTNGPINIWCVGKNGGSGSFTINGGNSSIKMSTDPTKAARVYLSDKCNLTLNGNGEGHFGVYAINDSTTGGNVTLNGNNDLYGSVICNTYTFNGTNTIRYTSGYFSAGDSRWIFDGLWNEINPR
jgi:Tfp pilus assembly protein PilX